MVRGGVVTFLDGADAGRSSNGLRKVRIVCDPDEAEVCVDSLLGLFVAWRQSVETWLCVDEGLKDDFAFERSSFFPGETHWMLTRHATKVTSWLILKMMIILSYATG